MYALFIVVFQAEPLSSVTVCPHRRQFHLCNHCRRHLHLLRHVRVRRSRFQLRCNHLRLCRRHSKLSTRSGNRPRQNQRGRLCRPQVRWCYSCPCPFPSSTTRQGHERGWQDRGCSADCNWCKEGGRLCDLVHKCTSIFLHRVAHDSQPLRCCSKRICWTITVSAGVTFLSLGRTASGR